MSDENVPTVIVESEGVKITVTDRMSAEVALPFIEGALEYHLNWDGKAPTRKRRHTPVDVGCDKCGYEWEYRGKSSSGTTCPDCGKHTRIDAETEDRL